MKHVLLFSLLSICMLSVNSQFAFIDKSMSPAGYTAYTPAMEGLNIGTQSDESSIKMSATVFKNQQYCRAELKDFDFDFHYSVTGADVYFSGANFKNVERGVITSSSLKSIKSLMDRCIPGTIVLFDNVKVMGQDKHLRVIPGITLMLY